MIGPFRNKYFFLSNMFPTPVTIAGMGKFKCAEAAFQSCKCADPKDIELFRNLDGKNAKSFGRKGIMLQDGHMVKFSLRPHWNKVRVEAMRKIVRAKFSDPKLAELLLATGEEELVELNTWGDKFWGAVNENGNLVGDNHLGKILIGVRHEIRNFREKAPVELSVEQQQIINDIIDDICCSSVATTHLIVGNAGTGKSTLLYYLQHELYMKTSDLITVCAPTNKACRVLTKKGITNTQTVHHAFMRPDEEAVSLKFRCNTNGSKYCIIDEASMLDAKVLDILKDFQEYQDTHFVFVGDNFQLPPVEKGGKDVFKRYDKVHYLSKVFRQEQGSEILDLATALRTEKQCLLPSVSLGQVIVTEGKEALTDYVAAIKQQRSAIAVVATNNMRNRVNNAVRKLLGYSDKPVDGEHLISVSNSKEFSNGETFELGKIKQVYPVTIVLTDGSEVAAFSVVEDTNVTLLLKDCNRASVYHQQIQDVKGSPTAIRTVCRYSMFDALSGGHQVEPDITIAYYGYAITAHKAQGSQWDEVFLLQTQNRDDEEAVRWLYTAVTRAAKRLVLCKQANIVNRTWEEIKTEEKNMKTAIVGVTEGYDPAYSNACKKEENKMKFTVRKIGAGKVAGEHCKGGVSAYKEGSYASAILLPYKGYRFNPTKDDAMEFRGIILDTVNNVQYNTYLYVAANTVEEAQEMIRAWVNRKIGPKPGTVIWKNPDTCKKYGFDFACLKKVPDKGTGRRMLVWAFEAEHYEGPHFLYAKETMDAGSTGDIMSLLKAQETEIAVLKEENSKLREDLESLRKIVAQLQVAIEFGAIKNNDDDDNDDGGDNNDDDSYNGGGGTKFTEEELDNFEPSELDDIPVDETPDVDEQQPTPETPAVPTAPTKQEVLDADKFVSGAVAEIDLLMTPEQKQATIKNCDAKVMRAMEALKVLGVDADTMQRLVRRAKRQTGVFRFADIKVEDGVVYARQYMGVNVWFKLSIDNDKLVVVKQ